MSYLETLRESAKETKSIVCMGLDPVPKYLPDEFQKDGVKGIDDFYSSLFSLMKEQQVFPGAFKLNQGFFITWDEPSNRKYLGSEELDWVMTHLREQFPHIPVILDYKRGDIKDSSANYAEEGLGCLNWGADAVTVHPYMGTDSVAPFLEYCVEHHGKGVYILNRTSNPGAKDFQNLEVVLDKQAFLTGMREQLQQLCVQYIENAGSMSETPHFAEALGVIIGKANERFNESFDWSSLPPGAIPTPLYQVVSHKILEWAQDHPGVGAVVGATSPDELSEIARIYAGKDIPLLIPGVGKQGGSASEVVKRLKEANYDLSLVRINSSSALTHSWAPNPAPKDWKDLCIANLRKLNEEISYQL